MIHILLRTNLAVFIIISAYTICIGQEVPILNYFINEYNQVQLDISSSENNYYILKVRHDPEEDFEILASMTLGESEKTIITESLSHYPIDHYQVLEYLISSPADSDNDGIDDITEFRNMPTQSPLNSALEIAQEDGSVALDNFAIFKGLSITEEFVKWSEFLNGKVHVKYMISDFHSNNPKVYFINSNTHSLHADFAGAVGIESLGDQVKKGQVIYHPTIISENGTIGTYAFNYSNGKGQDFEIVRRTTELLAANMPFLKNNLSHFITANNEGEYDRDFADYQNSRIPILLESTVFEDIDYWGLNAAEGYGLLRHLDAEDIPGSRDIVIYDEIPNTLARVAGIITSTTQTPLSHVNIRAIQEKIPNAFIKDPLSIDSIANLLNQYVYYKVEEDNYIIRAASLDQVNEWFEKSRPQTEQIPNLNLSYTSILPLDSIRFGMQDGFGAKCTNVSTMRSFGFPEGTIPDGYGIPFYFYNEFINFNNLSDQIETMISDPKFQSDRLVREERLDAFRKDIRKSDMPEWMLDELNNLYKSFPEGTSLRCRSSTNNEDLPGFNGAGLYNSKTHRPDEGHLSKTIKQVYASLWNLRAYDEREFYRIDHQQAAMGVLCHPNFSDEKANGVAISLDPIYNTDNTFYLNTQIGEDLITNPETNASPEEILLDKISVGKNNFIVVQKSSLSSGDTTIMNQSYLNEMRDFLNVIHREFAKLYNATNNETFAMDIEYKITDRDQLIIKQARPWVTFLPEELSNLPLENKLELLVYPNPSSRFLTAQCQNCEMRTANIISISGQWVTSIGIDDGTTSISEYDISLILPGVYIINVITTDDRLISSLFLKR